MRVIVILGPTASGKTNTAFELAKAINGEIISADSVQIYKFFDIGSAKPTKKQMEEIPHHLIDIKYPNEEFSAVDFAKSAKLLVEEIKAKGKVPILVGGTLFYIDALLNGLDLIPHVDSNIKSFFNDISEEKFLDLYNWIKIIDPLWGKKINKNDRQRINRALSVFLQTGKPLTSFFINKKTEKFFDSCTIFSLQISDNELEKRIIERTNNILEGLINETKKLVSMGFAQTKPMQSIGYRQALDYINGKLNIAEMKDLIIKETRLYAKRQKTYFNSKFKDKSISVSYKNSLEAILNCLQIDKF